MEGCFGTRIALVVLACMIPQSDGKNPSATLTVEEGLSLVGEVCPGKIQIMCIGLDLGSLRWKYNGNIQIQVYFSDSMPSKNNATDINPAFLCVELTSIIQNFEDPNFGNFSSKLTLDLSKLSGIRNITCGDADANDTIPVDATVIQEREPDTPSGVAVTAVYESGLLIEVIVFWINQERNCSNFLRYEVTLCNEVTLLKTDMLINDSSCGLMCNATFGNFSLNNTESDAYTLSMKAVNSFGDSEVFNYPTTIMKQSESFFIPMIHLTDCESTGECFSNQSLGTSGCNVSYRSNLTSTNYSPLFLPFNTRRDIKLYNLTQSADTVYCFEFTVTVNETLLVKNRIYETIMSSSMRTSTWHKVLLALTGIFFPVELILNCGLICIHFHKQILNWLKKKTISVVLMVLILVEIFSFILLYIISFIVIFVPRDTCNSDWMRTRDAFTILPFIGSLLAGFSFLITCILVAYGK